MTENTVTVERVPEGLVKKIAALLAYHVGEVARLSEPKVHWEEGPERAAARLERYKHETQGMILIVLAMQAEDRRRVEEAFWVETGRDLITHHVAGVVQLKRGGG